MNRQEQINRLKDYLSTLTDEQVWSFRELNHQTMWPDSGTLFWELHEERKRRGMAVSNRSGRVLYIKPSQELGRCQHCWELFTREEFVNNHNYY